MGILLALNTATQNTEIAILDGHRILKEDKWPAESNESDRILPYLRDTLNMLGLSFKDITALFIVNGPGHFTALRIGITIVNALAYALNVPIYAMDTFELMRLRAATAEPLMVLLEGGGESKFSKKFPSDEEPKIGPLEDHLKEFCIRKTTYNMGRTGLACDLKKNPSKIKCVKLLSFGEALLTQDFSKLEKSDIIKPLYLRAPNITVKK